MVRRFKNRVKISEVQEEFDKLCSRIDNLNQIITDVQGYGENFDYSMGSTQLSPAGYTLTIGGLKTALEGADGLVLGGKAFRIDSNHIKMTTGMLITKDRAYKLPDSVLTVPNGKHTLYYLPSTQKYQWTGQGTESEVVERTAQVGSKMTLASQSPPLLSNNAWYYLPVYTSSTEGERILLNPKSSFQWQGKIRFYKNATEISEDTKSVQLGLPEYPHSVGFGFLNNTSKIYTYQPSCYAYPTTLVMGYYDAKTTQFTPKLIVDTCTNGSGTGSNILSTSFNYTGLNFSRNTAGYTELGFTYDSYAEGKHGDITLTGSGYNEPTLLNTNNAMGCLSFYTDDNGAQRVNYTLQYIGDDGRDFDLGTTVLPFKIEDLQINCILLSSKDSATLANNADPETTVARDYYRDTFMSFPYSDLAIYNTEVDGQLTLTAGLNMNSQYVKYYETIEVPSEEAAYRICDINMNRDSIYVNDNLGVQCENIYGTYKIQTENRTYSGDRSNTDSSTTRKKCFMNNLDWNSTNLFSGCYEAINNNNEAKFCVPLENIERDDDSRVEAHFNNYRISFNKCVSRALKMAGFMNYLLLPKGVPNPFTYKIYSSGWDTESYRYLITDDPRKAGCQKEYNVKISKTLKQKTS